jgi:peptide/nickel transport system substrate-binding protein
MYVVQRRRGGLGGLVLAATMLLALLAAACSGGGSTSSSADDSAAGGASIGDGDPAGIVQVGYDMVQAGGGGIQLDPAETRTSGTNDALLYFIYGRLMRPTSDGDIVPDLAESATVVDPNTIEVVVRSDVTFQDGTPFDAAVVKAGLDRNLASGNVQAFTDAFFAVESVDVTGPATVRLTIPNGTAASWFDSFMAGWQVTIVGPSTDFSAPVGAGPMTVDRYVPESSLSLTKWDGYWDADSIAVGGMELTQVSIDQPQAAIAAVTSGQVDFVSSDPQQVASLSGSVEALITPNPNQTVSMAMCKSEGPLADVNIRRAINKAIDREAVGEVVFNGTTDPATEPWPADHRFYNPEVGEDLAFDPEAARQLVAESDYPDGAEFDLYVIPALGLPEVAAVLKQQLADIGITMNITTAANYVEEFVRPQVPGAGLFPGSAPNRQKLNNWHGDTLANVCGYENAELDSLIEQLDTVSDSSDEAVALWHQIDELVVEDAASGFVVFRSGVAAYDADRLLEIEVWPVGAIQVPDPRSTVVAAAG